MPAQDSTPRWPAPGAPCKEVHAQHIVPLSVSSSLPLAPFVLSPTPRERQPYPGFTDKETEAQEDGVTAQGHWGERMALGPRSPDSWDLGKLQATPGRKHPPPLLGR